MQPKFTQRNLGHYCLRIFAIALIFISTAQFSYSQKKGLTPVPLTAQKEAELHQLKAQKINTPTAVSTSKSANDAGKVTTVNTTHQTNGTTAICATFAGSLTASDPTMTGVRMFRDGVPSTCAAPKGACPGTSGLAGNSYDLYTFVNASASAQCVTINLSNTSSALNSIFCAAYIGAYSPANVCTNYLADAGNSVFQGLDQAFSFTLPGSATVTLVVNTVAPAAFADYVLTVDGICAPCAGTPAPGNTISSAFPTVCSATTFTLSTQNSTAGSGVSYQWKQSTTGVGGTYTNCPGSSTSSTYTASQTVATAYECVVTCAVSGLSGTSTPVFVGMAPQSGCYCLAGGSDGTFESISNFTLGTINNSTTGTSGYENWTTLSTPLEFSHPYAFTIQNAFGFPTDQAIIWIDFNQDGDFNDPGEQVFASAQGGGPYTGTITVPAGATLGATRLRIRIHDTSFNPNATPCGNSDYGEVEDYTVVITPCTTLSAPTQPVSTSVMCGNTATFTLGGTGSFLEYEWQQNTNATTPNWTVVSNSAVFSGANTKTLTIANPPITMSGYQYRVAYKGSCTPTTFSNVVTLTVTPFVPTINPASATICSGAIQKLTITNLSSPAPATQTTASGTINLLIPDDGTNTGINHTIAVPALPAGAVVTGFDVTLNIAHTYVGDMVITLKNPQGKILNLDYGLTGTGGPGATAGFTNTVIGDDGVNSLVSGSDPWTGLFAPDNQDPALAGTVALGPVGFLPTTRILKDMTLPGIENGGNWTIAMFDYSPPDQGTLKSWSITIRYSIGLPALGTWGPTTPTNTIFTDAAATIPYVAGTPINAVWVKPGTTAGTTNYTATVTNGGACTGTATIPVTVAVRPTGLNITSSTPAGVCTAGNTALTINTAAGTGNAVAYAWQVSTNGGVTYTTLTAAAPYSTVTTKTLTITAAPFSLNGYLYRAILTTTACAAVKDTSAPFTLNVFATPVVVINVGPYTKLLPNLTTTLTAATSPNAGATYSWFKTSQAYSTAPVVTTQVAGATTNTLVVTNDDLASSLIGTQYYATVVDANGCTSAKSNTIAIFDSTSADVYIYPNPSRGTFQVRYHSVLANRLARGLNVYDDKGGRVYSQSYANTLPYTRMDVDLRAFGKGVYWVEIVDSKGNRLAVKKVVIL